MGDAAFLYMTHVGGFMRRDVKRKKLKDSLDMEPADWKQLNKGCEEAEIVEDKELEPPCE